MSYQGNITLRLGYYQGLIKHRMSEAGDPFRALHHKTWFGTTPCGTLDCRIRSSRRGCQSSASQTYSLFVGWWQERSHM